MARWWNNSASKKIIDLSGGMTEDLLYADGKHGLGRIMHVRGGLVIDAFSAVLCGHIGMWLWEGRHGIESGCGWKVDENRIENCFSFNCCHHKEIIDLIRPWRFWISCDSHWNVHNLTLSDPECDRKHSAVSPIARINLPKKIFPCAHSTWTWNNNSLLKNHYHSIESHRHLQSPYTLSNFNSLFSYIPSRSALTSILFAPHMKLLKNLSLPVSVYTRFITCIHNLITCII